MLILLAASVFAPGTHGRVGRSGLSLPCRFHFEVWEPLGEESFLMIWNRLRRRLRGLLLRPRLHRTEALLSTTAGRTRRSTTSRPVFLLSSSVAPCCLYRIVSHVLDAIAARFSKSNTEPTRVLGTRKPTRDMLLPCCFRLLLHASGSA